MLVTSNLLILVATNVLFPHSLKGDFRLLRHTIKKRLRAKLAELHQLLLVRRHLPLDEVGSWLRRVVRGYSNYHSVPGNSAAMQAFYREVVRGWHQSIRRRSQRCRMTRSRFRKLLQRRIPFPRLVHPHPRVRILAKHLGQEPYAVTPHVRICARGAASNGRPYRDRRKRRRKFSAVNFSSRKRG